MICKMRGTGNNYKNIFLNYLLQINKKFYQLTSSEDQAMIVLEGKEKQLMPANNLRFLM